MLAEYLASVTDRRWSPGDLDCCTFMCDWMVSQGGADAMADIRGTYHDRAGYRRIMRGEGGFLNACSARFARAGFPVAPSPQPGDIALVLAPAFIRKEQVVRVHAGAICVTETLRAVVTPDAGLVISSSLPTVKAWTL